MTLKWAIWCFFFSIFLLLEGAVLYKSFSEQHYHGYDGGYFLLFVGFGSIGGILFTIWAVINTIITKWHEKDKQQ